LSTVQSLPDAERAAFERALVSLARDAAVGALAADVAHDAANALFGLRGLLDLLEEGRPLDRERIAVLQRTAAGLEDASAPLLEFLRSAYDGRPEADLTAAVGLALRLFRHGRRPPVDETLPPTPVVVACPPGLAAQAAVQLLLAAAAASRIRVDLTSDALAVSPAAAESLDEVVVRRIAVDQGGTLAREGDALVLRLRPAERP
jgi:signal transduction histidine kinase